MSIAPPDNMPIDLPRHARVFLTNPPLNLAETPLQYHRPLIPMGLATLGGVIEDAATGGAWDDHVRAVAAGKVRCRYRASGVVAIQDNMFLSFYDRFDFSRLLDRMDRFLTAAPPRARYIGLSVLSDGMHGARQMLRIFRRRFPGATLIVGGPHATFFPFDFYERPDERHGPLADYIVRNDGERVLLAILRGQLLSAGHLANNATTVPVDMQGCDYSDPRYRVIDGGQYRGSEAFTDAHVLDELPAPAYFLFEDEAGVLPYEPDRRYGLTPPAANINSSRGCPHKCTFCTIPKLAPGYRTLSPERICQFVAFLDAQYGVQSIFFREDNFMYSGGGVGGDRWPDVLSISSALASRSQRVRWAIEARADNLLADSGVAGASRLALLRKGGLSGIYMGVESGSERMLRLYAKDATLSTMKAAIGACNEEGVAVVATACYSDPDLLKKSLHSIIDPSNPRYLSDISRDRSEILRTTRELMDELRVPDERREEYALVGIPVSTTYEVLSKAMAEWPQLVEHYDPVTRYIFPKGFRWWASRIYKPERRARPFFGFNYRDGYRFADSAAI